MSLGYYCDTSKLLCERTDKKNPPYPYTSEGLERCTLECAEGNWSNVRWKCSNDYKCKGITDWTDSDNFPYTKKDVCDTDCVEPSGLSAGIIVLIVLVPIILLGILLFIIWKRKHKSTLVSTSSPISTPTLSVPTESSEASTESSSEEVVTGGF